MKFSVLIPVYNTEKYLEKCLQSVLNQTYQDFEIIIVDDGSTDGSGEICDKYMVDYPEIIKVIHKENQGLISARRVGIDNAKSDYCIFVDSDDYIKDNLLESLQNILVHDYEIDLLIYSFCYIRNGVFERNYPRIAEDNTIWQNDNRGQLINHFLYSNNVTTMWIKAVKTTLLQSDSTDYSKYFGKNMAEDYLQSLYLITYAQKIVYYYLPLYCYNYNDESISRSYTSESISKQNKLHVYYVLLEYLKIWNMNDSETIKKINAKWFNDTMYLFFKCYENAKSKIEKDTILSYNWDSMIPNDNIDSFRMYTNESYLNIYEFWKNNENKKLNLYFIKRKIYQKSKRLKRRITNK